MRQLENKWDRLKKLYKKPRRNMTPPELRIFTSRLYKQYLLKLKSSGNNRNNNNDLAAVPSTSRNDQQHRTQSTASNSINVEPIDEPLNDAALNFQALKVQRLQLQIRQAEFNVQEANYMAERAHYLRELARIQLEQQDGRDRLIDDLS